MFDITVIIVSWNCRAFVEDCLASIDASPTRSSYEIILVDNNSSDGTAAMVSSTYPSVKIITNNDNVGFARANNQAMAVAAGRNILLLNPDTKILGSCLDILAEFLDGAADGGGVGPMIFDGSGHPQNSGVRFPDNWDILVESFFLDKLFPNSRTFGRHRQLYEKDSTPRQVDLVQGSCLMVPKHIMDSIGGLDERFFMYFEEVDWCKRIKDSGKNIYLCPAATIVHYGGGPGHYDERRIVNYHKSLLLFYRKHFSRLSEVSLRLILFIRSLIRIVVWSGWMLIRPKQMKSALSSVRGYARTVRLVIGGIK